MQKKALLYSTYYAAEQKTFYISSTFPARQDLREADGRMLYNFYYMMFESFHKHSDFAKVLMKEQVHSFNEDFIHKMRTYDAAVNESILLMIERLYGEEIAETKYDLMYCIKGFIKTYSELFLFQNLPLNLELLASSLVEKTNLLAAQITIPFVSANLHEIVKQPINQQLSAEQIAKMIDRNIEELEDSIEKESLVLLKEQLIEPDLPRAVIAGLLENISRHSHCKWTAYVLRGYFPVDGI